MVNWTISQYKVDQEKVFVTGSSSGAMMTLRLFLPIPNHTFAMFIHSAPEPHTHTPIILPHNIILITLAECHGSNLPRSLSRRNTLLRRERRLLRLLFGRHRRLEQHLCTRTIHRHVRRVGRRSKSHVSRLQKDTAAHANLPRQYGCDAAAAKLPGDNEAVGRRVGVRLRQAPECQGE